MVNVVDRVHLLSIIFFPLLSRSRSGVDLCVMPSLGFFSPTTISGFVISSYPPLTSFSECARARFVLSFLYCAFLSHIPPFPTAFLPHFSLHSWIKLR